MASVYTNDLRLEEIGSGEQSGSWGDTTNTNLELIAEAFSFGTEAITTNADTHATTIADGATDAGRSMFLKYTGTLDSACTITIGPNTVSKLWFIENGTSGSQNIIIKQGSGATITISAGQTKAIYSNGAGSGAAMVDAFASLSVVDLIVSDDLVVGDDLGVTGLVTVGETLAVTGVLTTTAATVFNGGFASNDGSTISTADNTDTLTLISTDADAAVGPNLILYRNSASPEDDNQLGKIKFTGRNDNSQDVNYAQFVNQIKDASDGAESARFALFSMVGGTDTSRLEALPAETVFNENQVDIDFRVESDGNAHMLFVDAGNNHVNIGTSSDLGGVLNVSSSDNTDTLVVYSDDADNNAGPNIRLWRNSSSPADNDGLGKILFSGEDSADAKTDYASIKAFALDVTNGTEDGELTLTTILAGAEANRLDFNSTATIFNESSNDLDFRIESNGAVNKFFVDGAEDIISIGGGESYLVGGFKNSLQVVGTGATTSSISVTRNSNDVNPPYINFGKTRGAIGSVTAVNNNDEVGRLAWHAADSTDVTSEVCRISAAIDGSVNTANDTPGRLMFATTADGAASATERMRIDALGVVSIKNTGSTANFVGQTDSSFVLGSGSGNHAMTIFTGTANNGSIFFADGRAADSTTGRGGLQYLHNSDALRFFTSGSATNGMTINSAGSVIVSGTGWDGGLDNSDTNIKGHLFNPNGGHLLQIDANSTGAETIIVNNILASGATAGVLQYRTQAAVEGSLNGNGSGLAISNVSDYRKKENITDLSGSLAKIKALRPVTFTHRSAYTTDTSAVKTGMIAHEVAAVLPNLVVGEKDAVDDDGEIVLQALSYSGDEMITHLIGAIKELEARIATLEG